MNSIIASRPMNFFERVTANVFPCFINLAIDIEDPKVIPDYLEIIKRNSPPFYMKADKENLYRFANAKFPIHNIPETITDLKDSIVWSLKNCPATGSDPLATVAVNSHKIVLNYCHSFFSGAMLMHVVNEIQNPSNLEIPIFPLTIEETYPLHEIQPLSYHYQLPHLTHYINKRVKYPDQTDIFQQVNSQFDITKLPCCKYNNQKYEIKELTEYLASCFILSAKALNLKNGLSGCDNGWGTGTAYDMRRSLPFENCGLKALNLVGNMFMFSDKKPKTVGELMTNLRNELNNAINNKLWLNHFKWAFLNQNEERNRLGLMLFMTNVGQIKIKYPINDIMMWFCNDFPEDVLYLLTYSVIKEEIKSNTLKTSLIYGRNEINKAEVNQIDNTLKYAINNLKKSDKIDEILNELINFNSYK